MNGKALLTLLALVAIGCEGLPAEIQPQARLGSALAIAAQYAYAGPFKEGLAAMQVGDEKTGLWGLINTSGKSVIPAQCDSVQVFSDGLCAVRIGGEEGKWGFIDKLGKLAINPRFASVWPPGFVDGFAAVDVAKKYPIESAGLINKSGSFVVPARFDTIGPYREGLAIGSHWGYAPPTRSAEYFDKDGKSVFGAKFSSGGYFRDGVAPAAISQGKLIKWGIINRAGSFVAPPNYDNVGDFSEGYASVGVGDLEAMSNDKVEYGFVDTKGELVIPLQFNLAGDFSEGLAWVRIGDLKTGNSGIMDYDGKYAIPPKFSDASSFKEGLAAASVDGKRCGYIDKTGTFVIPPKYNSAADLSHRLGSVSVKNGDRSRWGS